MFLHKAAYSTEDTVIFPASEHTPRLFHNIVAVSCIKAHYNPAVTAHADRHLCLVAVMIRVIHSDGRLYRHRKSADSFQMVCHLVLLKPKLSLIGHRLQLTATAAARRRAGLGDAILRRFEDANHATVAVCFLYLRDRNFHAVPQHGVFNKKGKAFYFP